MSDSVRTPPLEMTLPAMKWRRAVFGIILPMHVLGIIVFSLGLLAVIRESGNGVSTMFFAGAISSSAVVVIHYINARYDKSSSALREAFNA